MRTIKRQRKDVGFGWEKRIGSPATEEVIAGETIRTPAVSTTLRLTGPMIKSTDGKSVKGTSVLVPVDTLHSWCHLAGAPAMVGTYQADGSPSDGKATLADAVKLADWLRDLGKDGETITISGPAGTAESLL